MEIKPKRPNKLVKGIGVGVLAIIMLVLLVMSVRIMWTQHVNSAEYKYSQRRDAIIEDLPNIMAGMENAVICNYGVKEDGTPNIRLCKEMVQNAINANLPQ